MKNNKVSHEISMTDCGETDSSYCGINASYRNFLFIFHPLVYQISTIFETIEIRSRGPVFIREWGILYKKLNRNKGLFEIIIPKFAI